MIHALKSSLARRLHGDTLLFQHGASQITDLHFKPITGAAARRAFKSAVTSVDFEIFSQCNRRCGYCSNSFNDRLSENHVLDPQVFARVLGDLRSVDYRGAIRILGLNEPSMHAGLLVERVTQIRRALRHAQISAHTNGDYLRTRASLQALKRAGVDTLWMSIHLQRFMPFEQSKIEARIEDYAKETGLSCSLKYTVRHPQTVTGTIITPDIPTINFYQSDYANIGHDRGGLMPHIGPQNTTRTAACVVPATMIAISHNGVAMPCSHFNGDVPGHEAFRLGDLSHGQSIFDVYGSAAAAAFRRKLFSLEPKTKICGNCVDYAAEPALNDPEKVRAL